MSLHRLCWLLLLIDTAVFVMGISGGPAWWQYVWLMGFNCTVSKRYVDDLVSTAQGGPSHRQHMPADVREHRGDWCGFCAAGERPERAAVGSIQSAYWKRRKSGCLSRVTVISIK